jgi:uncharacterized membrane protein
MRSRSIQPNRRSRRKTSLAALTALALVAACQNAESPTLGAPSDEVRGNATRCEQAFQSVDVPGATLVFASGINDDGYVTGRWDDRDGVSHGYLRDPDGTIHTIQVPGSIFTSATGISAAGVIAGIYMDREGRNHGFTLTRGTFKTIDYPGAVDTRIRDITSNGVLTGNYGNLGAGVEHGFIKDATGLHSVDYPGSLGTDVWAGDGVGRFVGDWADGDGGVHGYLLENGSFSAFDVPGVNGGTVARGINRAGVIVGIFENPRTFQIHGFIKIGGHYQVVDFPGGTDTNLIHINNYGVITGIYTDANDVVHGLIMRSCVGST